MSFVYLMWSLLITLLAHDSFVRHAVRWRITDKRMISFHSKFIIIQLMFRFTWPKENLCTHVTSHATQIYLPLPAALHQSNQFSIFNYCYLVYHLRLWHLFGHTKRTKKYNFFQESESICSDNRLDFRRHVYLQK